MTLLRVASSSSTTWTIGLRSVMGVSSNSRQRRQQAIRTFAAIVGRALCPDGLAVVARLATAPSANGGLHDGPISKRGAARRCCSRGRRLAPATSIEPAPSSVQAFQRLTDYGGPHAEEATGCRPACPVTCCGRRG